MLLWTLLFTHPGAKDVCFSGWYASIAPHCFLSGHSSMDMAVETPGPRHETHSDEGKKDSAISRALLVMDPPTCPTSSPSFKIRCPSTSPAQTLLRASSGPCYGPDPSHYLLFTCSPSHWLWPCICPPCRVSELPFGPCFLLLVDWVWGQPLLYSLLFLGFFQHISYQKAFKMGFSFKESFPEVFSLHLPGNSLALENSHS